MGLSFCQCGQIKGQCGCKTVRKTTKERGYGNDWKMLSERYRNENPLCEDCFSNGVVSPCTEVHHKVPVSVDRSLRLEVDNLVALCSKCHEARHGGP